MPLSFSESEETQNQKNEPFDSSDYNNDEPNSYIMKLKSSNGINEEASGRNHECHDQPESKDLIQADIEQDKKPRHVYISEDLEEDLIVETTALRQHSEPSNSTLDTAIMADNYLTVSGTIKRGKKKDQSVEVILNMSREELEILEANMTNKKRCNCKTGNCFGVHVFLWSIICFPISIIISAMYSFFMGTITWYNLFSLFSEQKPICYRILLPPLLIILYPLLIISLSLGLGIYAGFKQLSCCWDSWCKEFTDYEKGFYSWLCNSLDIPECSPYEVVILSSVQKQ